MAASLKQVNKTSRVSPITTTPTTQHTRTARRSSVTFAIFQGEPLPGIALSAVRLEAQRLLGVSARRRVGSARRWRGEISGSC